MFSLLSSKSTLNKADKLKVLSSTITDETCWFVTTSNSKEDEKHICSVNIDGSYLCNCKGSEHGICSHIIAGLKLLNDDQLRKYTKALVMRQAEKKKNGNESSIHS